MQLSAARRTGAARKFDKTYDAIIVGSGPNGLAAALILAQARLKVLVVEARATLGGGTRTAELTLPGFHHDICSAVHPLGVASPFLRDLPLAEHGVEWITPTVSVAHPLDNEPAAAIHHSLEETVAQLGADGAAWRRMLAPMVDNWQSLIAEFLAPLHFPRKPLQYARFGAVGGLPATWAGRMLFHTERGRAAFAGMAGHAMIPLERAPSAAFGLMLSMLANSVGWPIARGGSQSIADALVAMIRALGGEFQTDFEVTDLNQLPPARAILLDVTPRQLLAMGRDRLPAGYQRALSRFRYNPGVFKMDWALSQPIPWRDLVCHETATLHLGGTMEEIAASEAAVWRGEIPQHPYVLMAQPTLFDTSRAPSGQHTAWGYCHVPSGSTVDMTAAIEAQIERFAPGFGETILARHTYNSVQMEAHNPNYVGGDINGGVQDLLQQFMRPVPTLTPYRTPIPGLYLCSSSTPPGGGVHGMCGYYAAQSALEDLGVQTAHIERAI
jgi:phytoene dehydrogenase-like protein